MSLTNKIFIIHINFVLGGLLLNFIIINTVESKDSFKKINENKFKSI